jgi:hypothetical protein
MRETLVRQLGRHFCQLRANSLPKGNRGGPILNRPVQVALKNAVKSRQRLVSNTSRLHWLRFSVPFLSCKANTRVWLKNGTRPPNSRRSWVKMIPQVAEVFCQSDPIPSGLNCRHPSNRRSFPQGQIAWRVRLPASVNNCQPEHVKTLRQDNNPQLLLIKLRLAISLKSFLSRNCLN